ncbi:hypothetical protein HDV00_006332 [Rhizophlyctis rosea]|nr:hypothetical protein HDV00_006332 [Rhizophlyctis rosea]
MSSQNTAGSGMSKKTNGHTFKVADQLNGAASFQYEGEADGVANPEPIKSTAKAAGRKGKQALETAQAAGKEIARDAQATTEALSEAATDKKRSVEEAGSAGASGTTEATPGEPSFKERGFLEKGAFLLGRGARVTAPKVAAKTGSAVLHGTLAWWEALAGVPLTMTRLTAQGIVGATGYSYGVAKGLIGGGVNIASSAGQFAIGTGLAVADTAGSVVDRAAHAVTPSSLVPYVDSTSDLVKRARQDPIGAARGIVPEPIFGKVEGAVQSISSTKTFAIDQASRATNHISTKSEETVRGTLSALVESEKYVWEKYYSDVSQTKGALWDACDSLVGTVPGAKLERVISYMPFAFAPAAAPTAAASG